MTRGRRALGRLVVIWLACQTGSMAVAAIALSVDMSAACVCPQGADAACPMHHTSASGAKVCAMRALTDPDTATLSAILGLNAPVPTSPSAIAPASDTFDRPAPLPVVSTRPIPPDPPPPRA